MLGGRRQLICSTGALTKILSSFHAKNISVFQKLKSVYSWLVPLRHEGRTRRHERGAECGGRECADRRTAYSRTAKSCGPGAPMQGAKLSRDSKGPAKATVANKQRFTEEITK